MTGSPPPVQEGTAVRTFKRYYAARQRVNLSGPTLRDVTAEVEWAKATLQTPESYPAAALDAAVS